MAALSALSPMLLSSGPRLPTDFSRWVMQPKWDGVRVLVGIERDGVRWRSRRGTDLSGLAPRADESLRALPPGSVLDGELICPVSREHYAVTQSFAAVRDAIFRRRPSSQLVLVAWDVLLSKGHDVRAQSWSARQEILRSLVPDASAALTVSPTWSPSSDLLERLLALGWEGAVVKRLGSAYRSGLRTRDWVKHKARLHLEGQVVELGTDRTRRAPRALVRLEDGVRSWALAPRDVGVGDLVTVRFARRDADGQLRDARALAATP